MTKEVRPYQTANGAVPFQRWFDKLRDDKGRALILNKLDALAGGLATDTKRLTGGLYELRVHYGPGYRVYLADDGDVLIILLCAGRKADQSADIENAKRYWNDYKSRADD